MQQTFQLNTDNLSVDFIDSIRTMFEHRVVKITVEEVAHQPGQQEEIHDQHQLFLKSQALQSQYPPIQVSPDVDLSALANEVNS